MSVSSAYEDFRVIIAGGGLAGLTLANALERAGIDYVLLEARAVIDPAVGASMGIMPNGCRILDQLGCFDDILDVTSPIRSSGSHTRSGELIMPRLDSPILGVKRTGYEAVFLNRQLVLQILYKRLKDKSKILTSRRISSVDHTAKGVTVRCEDGSSYTGDVIAGADGVFSTVRQEMWRVADQEDPGFIPKKEKGCMLAEYQVLFGISTATAGLKIGNYDITYMKDVSSMTIVGKDNIVYWFLFKRMDRVHKIGEIPKYTKAEAEAFAERHSDINLNKNPDVKFGDVWNNRTYYTLVATEEADFEHWTWGRFACLGDSVHKVTPNAGLGGNAGYESAAALANSLKLLLDSSSTRPTFEQVKHALKRYETSRRERASALNKIANNATRVQALKGPMERIFVYCIAPNSGDLLLNMMSDFLIGATKIDYLPPPKRSLTGTMPFNPQQGIGKKESILYRMLLTVPFFALSAFARNRMSAGVGFRDLAEILRNGRMTWNEGSFVLPEAFFGNKWLDNMIRPLTIIFSSSNFGIDPVSWWQMLSFITDLGVLYSIFLIEAGRRSNLLTFAQFPFLFTWVAQFFGIGAVAPIYFALYYIASQIANFKALDLRLTNLAYTRTVLPVMIVSFYIPHYVSYLAPDLAVRHAANWIWQLCPVWISGLQMLLAKTVMPDTISWDRIHAPTRDLATIRTAIGSCVALSGAVWLYTVVMSPFSIKVLFLPSFKVSQINWVECARGVLQFDYLFCWSSALLWLGYLFADLKHAGMVKQSWGLLLGAAALTTVGFGPGVTVGLGWLWREGILVTKRHRAAIVIEDVGVGNGAAARVKKEI